MKGENPLRIRETVYVVGAGFSAVLGHPLTNSILINVWKAVARTPANLGWQRFGGVG